MKFLTISYYGFQKLVREKVIFSFIFIGLLLILLSIVFGSMTFDEQARILVHFGSGSILFCLLGISLIYGSSLIRREIESQTILLTLARPLSRHVYFLGQWLALIWVLLLNWFALSFVIYALTSFSLPFESFMVAQLALFLQIVIVLTATMLFANFSRPVISFFAGLGIYFIGQWTPDLIFFAEKSKDDFFITFANLSHTIFPQLYRMNWQSYQQISTGNFVEPFALMAIHGAGWVMFFLVACLLTFRRKDLV